MLTAGQGMAGSYLLPSPKRAPPVEVKIRTCTRIEDMLPLEEIPAMTAILMMKPEIAEPVPSEARNLLRHRLRVCFGFASQPAIASSPCPNVCHGGGGFLRRSHLILPT